MPGASTEIIKVAWFYSFKSLSSSPLVSYWSWVFTFQIYFTNPSSHLAWNQTSLTILVCHSISTHPPRTFFPQVRQHGLLSSFFHSWSIGVTKSSLCGSYLFLVGNLLLAHEYFNLMKSFFAKGQCRSFIKKQAHYWCSSEVSQEKASPTGNINGCIMSNQRRT